MMNCKSDLEPELSAVENNSRSDIKGEPMKMVKVVTKIVSDCEDDEDYEQNETEIDAQSENNLGILFNRARSKSPVTVQDWVAALPDETDERDEEEMNIRDEISIADSDNLTLGAEGLEI